MCVWDAEGVNAGFCLAALCCGNPEGESENTSVAGWLHLCSLLNGITDRIGPDEIQGCNQVRDLLDDADQRNLSGPPLHSIPRSTESREARSAKKRLEYNIVSSKWLSFTSGFGNGASIQ
jgi:hypothetical protein